MLQQLTTGASLAEEEDFSIDDNADVDGVDDDDETDADVDVDVDVDGVDAVSVISCCESITLNISWGTLPNKTSGENRAR